MTTTDYDLAHFNLATARHPLDHPSMAGFANRLDEINRLVETSQGFVWTPVGDEAGDALAIFGSPLVLITFNDAFTCKPTAAGAMMSPAREDT
jgi:hypothetical protein